MFFKKYKKCPRCNVNYIQGNGTFCKSCQTEIGGKDFLKIQRGIVYGTNSCVIYEHFCDALGWDKSKATLFGFKRPLYADNADTYRTSDVWFICYPVYDSEALGNATDKDHINYIHSDGEIIEELVPEKVGRAHEANKIVFVKTQYGYEFFGVYKIVKNGILRKFQRISDTYPMK